jgi:hypothetical protein
VPAPDVAPSLAQLEAFQRDFEQVFLAMAVCLPVLSQAIAEISAQLAAVQGSENGLRTQVVTEVEAMVASTTAAVLTVLGQSEAGVGAAGELAQVAATLAGQLDEAQRVSLELRQAGMNASFAAKGLGTRGAAFSAVNRALVEVAQESAELVGAMHGSAHRASAAAAALGAGQVALTAEVAASAGDTEARSREALVGCTRTLEELARDLRAVGAGGEEVAVATEAIMATIQHQDILRQGLDHVVLVLGAVDEAYRGVAAAARPEEEVMGFLEFQAHAGRLCAELLGSLRGRLEALVLAVEAPVEALRGASARVHAQVRDPEAIEARVAAPATLLVEGLASLPPLDAAMEACRRSLESVVAEGSALRPKLAHLELIPLQVGLVGVLMKIELATTAGLGMASGIATDVARVGRRLRDLHLETSEATELLREPVARAGAALDRQRDSWAGLRGSPQRIGEGAGRVRALAAEFGHRLAALGGACEGLDRQSAGLRQGLEAFARSVAATAGMKEACRQLSLDAERQRTALLVQGLQADPEPSPLRALIDRFTLFEHKQLAAAAEEVTLEAGGRPGELTLF